MRSLLILVVVLACTSAALARIVCPVDACHRVHCPMDQGEEKCLARGIAGQYRYFLHSGFCGCCHECVKLLQVNENCLSTQIIGVSYHHNMCADGLICDHVKHVCVKA